MSMNGYSYVHGNPVNMTDPSGLCADWNVECKRLARQLHSRFGGNLEDWYAQPHDQLMRVSIGYHWLGASDFLRKGFEDSSVIPNAADVDKEATYQALWEYTGDNWESGNYSEAALGAAGLCITWWGEESQQVPFIIASTATLGSLSQAGTGTAAGTGAAVSGCNCAAGIGGSVVGGATIGYGFSDYWMEATEIMDHIMFSDTGGGGSPGGSGGTSPGGSSPGSPNPKWGLDEDDIQIDSNLTSDEIEQALDEMEKLITVDNPAIHYPRVNPNGNVQPINVTNGVWHRQKVVGSDWRNIFHIDRQNQKIEWIAILKRNSNTYEGTVRQFFREWEG